MKNRNNKTLLFLLGIAFAFILIMRFVLGWCNIWICLSGIGLVIIWQILSDFTDEKTNDTD